MEITEILEGDKKLIKANLLRLAEDYKEKTGRKVCTSCPADINYMILVLKNHYKMCQFRLKGANKQFKNKKTDLVTVKNATLTDEIAIDFLRTNPERIKLFDKFPSNWETLIIDGAIKETEEQKETRLAIEAERQAIAENEKPTRETMQRMSLSELRAKYPSIKARTINDFIDKVLAQ